MLLKFESSSLFQFIQKSTVNSNCFGADFAGLIDRQRCESIDIQQLLK